MLRQIKIFQDTYLVELFDSVETDVWIDKIGKRICISNRLGDNSKNSALLGAIIELLSNKLSLDLKAHQIAALREGLTLSCELGIDNTGWQEIARQFSKDIQYYKGLLDNVVS